MLSPLSALSLLFLPLLLAAAPIPLTGDEIKLIAPQHEDISDSTGHSSQTTSSQAASQSASSSHHSLAASIVIPIITVVFLSTLAFFAFRAYRAKRKHASSSPSSSDPMELSPSSISKALPPPYQREQVISIPITAAPSYPSSTLKKGEEWSERVGVRGSMIVEALPIQSYEGKEEGGREGP